MKKIIFAAVGLMLAVATTAHAVDQLDAARQLYLAASYEEALESLATVPSGADLDQVDKLRALCLLALSRNDEARKALESLASRRPLLQLDESESPKLVSLYREARLRMLPPATKSLYGVARASYEKGELEAAKQQFGDVLTLLADPELSKLPEIADLKLLAEGFANLVDQQLSRQTASSGAPAPTAAQPRPPAAAAQTSSKETSIPIPPPAAIQPPPQTSQTTAPAPGSVPASDRSTPPAVTAAVPAPAATDRAIFTVDDPGVTAPVAIEQRLPPWVPPAGLSDQSFSGSIELLVDEAGRVTVATMSKSVNASYDRLLLTQARTWRYRPATRNGRPVKFRRVVSIVLAPTK
jgi:hypothetical protein